MERNERVNDTCNKMQMPRVENKTIVIDDYSICSLSCWLLRHTVSSDHVIVVNPLLSVVALTMQILKPAGFVDTAHYPLDRKSVV